VLVFSPGKPDYFFGPAGGTAFAQIKYDPKPGQQLDCRFAD
jgi:hypothetical protein